MSQPEPADELAHLTQALAAEARRRRALGHRRVVLPAYELKPVPAPVATTTPPATPPAKTELFARKVAEPASPGANENRERAQGCADLAGLRALVADCTACTLSETRTQTVFADGTGSARVMFIGEAPGQHEDEQGVPFVGRAGQLLTDIIHKGMGLRREEVLIANVLKCRPPGNRDPKPEEKELCTPYLDRQIELVDPEVLITLGLHATQHLLRSTTSMGRLRGRVHRPPHLGGRKVVPTYHPAFLLRSPHMKKECWKDIQLAMAELGLSPP